MRTRACDHGNPQGLIQVRKPGREARRFYTRTGEQNGPIAIEIDAEFTGIVDVFKEKKCLWTVQEGEGPADHDAANPAS